MPLTTLFAELPDPRRETDNKLHGLVDILVITTCAVIAGSESWEAIAEYGRTKEDFFRRFLPLELAIPPSPSPVAPPARPAARKRPPREPEPLKRAKYVPPVKPAPPPTALQDRPVRISFRFL